MSSGKYTQPHRNSKIEEKERMASSVLRTQCNEVYNERAAESKREAQQLVDMSSRLERTESRTMVTDRIMQR